MLSQYNNNITLENKQKGGKSSISSPVGLFNANYESKIKLPYKIKNFIDENNFNNLFNKCCLEKSNKKKTKKNKNFSLKKSKKNKK
jgi:hypothetical protein